MIPVRLTTAQLAAALYEMASLIEVEDSFEGWVEYSLTEDEPGVWNVLGLYRVGNSMGQGGIRFLGDPATPPAEEEECSESSTKQDSTSASGPTTGAS